MTRIHRAVSLSKALLLAILAPAAAEASLGALGDDLVYVPVTPCRLIDTRLTAGDFAAGEQRHYDLIGRATFGIYGGADSDCGLGGTGAVSSIPQLAYNIPRALMLNFVAVGPLGPGHFTAWPTGEAMPNASILNYASAAGLNIANGVAVTTCGAICVDTTNPFTCDAAQVCPAGDLSVRASTSASHLVVDVVGYFRGADTTSLKALHSEGVAASDITLDDTCQTVAQCSITAPAGESGRVLVTASASVTFQNDDSSDRQQAGLTISSSGECGVSVEPGSVGIIMDSILTIGRFPAGLTKSFPLNSGQTGTYTLNARSLLGFEDGEDEVHGGTIECLFIP